MRALNELPPSRISLLALFIMALPLAACGGHEDKPLGANPVACREKSQTATTLEVNDTNSTGNAGDAVLSLAEAIQLANGTLALEGLSEGERAQIRGTPGPNSADLIRVVVGMINAPPPSADRTPVLPAACTAGQRWR